jgi:amino acid permease
MSEPTEMVKATRISLSIVLVLYIFMGDLISIIFMQSIKSDIISELPTTFFPTLLRILMSVVVITSIPLIIIPAGDLIHDKIVPNPNNSNRRTPVYVIRFLLAQLCAIISTMVPDFVFVLSFVGCFCVALLSFAYPPILHLTCVYRYYPKEKRYLKTNLIVADVILFVWGLIATVFTSVLTFRSMVAKMNNKEL